MIFVLDASVAAKWLLAEVDTDKARVVFREWAAGNIGLLAPEILPAEVASSLWKRVRRGDLPASEAIRMQKEFENLEIPLHPIRELVQEALLSAVQFRHSVYDGLYLALAYDVGAQVLTADEKLLKLVRPGAACLLRDWL